MKLLLEQWRKYITEDWQDTSWENDDDKVTIGEVVDYLGEKTVPIKVSDLTKQIPSLFDDEYRQSVEGRKRIETASLEFPIIVVKNKGQYKYVLDGNHRLQRAIDDEKVETIKAKILVLDDEETPERFKKMFGDTE
tara:strand:- start:173 stop:580 length:408 start_codon:yes stop_codon:yes gene_type:complete